MLTSGFEENGEEEAITAWIDHMKTENVPLNEASYLALLKLYVINVCQLEVC
jgi:hypothetical protein